MMEKFCSMSLQLLNFLKLLSTIFLIIFTLSGCSADSSSNRANGDIISELDSPNSNDEEERFTYEREEDYPNIITLPLKYFVASNGKKIGLSVTLPANENGEPIDRVFPTILVQTAYNMSIVSLPSSIGAMLGGPDPFFVKRGYAMVAVDVLGSGVSEGGWELLGEEEQNAYGDTVDWILNQTWSDGNIGVSGVSYMAISALFTAQQRPDAIKAVFAIAPIGDAHRGASGTGGLLNGVFMQIWMTLTQTLGTQNLLATLLHPEHTSQIMRSTREHIDHIDSFYLPLVDDALNAEPYITYDGDFWQTRSPLHNIDKITAPTFITGALHDLFQRGAPMLYEQLQKNVDARLAIFDGDHITNFVQAIPGNESISPLTVLMLQWFDKHIKGMNSGAEKIPAVTQYVKNYESDSSDGFSTTTTWPHPLTKPERWYLRGDMSLSAVPPIADETSHTIQASDSAEIKIGKSLGGEFLKFEVNPVDGTKCSISYRQWTLCIAGALSADLCFDDNKELEAEALNYETTAMADDYYFNGPIQADIWIDSTVTEAVVSVRVDEVSPDGEIVLPLTNGLLAATSRLVNIERSRFVDGEMIQPFHYLTQEEVLTVVPGEVFKMQIDIFPTSAIIRRGHRLRISISPSNQAQGIMNYVQQENSEGGITTIHNSPEYPSSIVLPIVPLSALN